MALSQSNRVRLTIVGHPGVGKTTLRRGLMKQAITPSIAPTVGYEQYDYAWQTPQGEIPLRIVDVAASHDGVLANSFLRKSDLVLITLNLWDDETERNRQLEEWNRLIDERNPTLKRIVAVRNDRYLAGLNPGQHLAPIIAGLHARGHTDVSTYSASVVGGFTDINTLLTSHLSQIHAKKTRAAAVHVRGNSKHPLLWGLFKWLLLPALLATILFFSGGLAAIPLVGAVVGLGAPAALAITTVTLSLVGNFFRKLFNAGCACFSRPKAADSAPPRTSSGAGSSTSLIHSKCRITVMPARAESRELAPPAPPPQDKTPAPVTREQTPGKAGVSFSP